MEAKFPDDEVYQEFREACSQLNDNPTNEHWFDLNPMEDSDVLESFPLMDGPAGFGGTELPPLAPASGSISPL